MQLNSKMRYISVQFEAYLSHGLWRDNARHANEMAALLKHGIDNIPGISVTQKVETNGIFAIIPQKFIQELQQEFFFYIWNEARSEVRWMTSFDTQAADIEAFVNLLTEKLA